VATKLSPQNIKLTLSAIVAPNPSSDDDISLSSRNTNYNHNNSFHNRIPNSIEVSLLRPIIDTNDSTQQILTVENNNNTSSQDNLNEEGNNDRTLNPHTTIPNPITRTKKYLISHFFEKITKKQSEPEKETDTDTNTTTNISPTDKLLNSEPRGEAENHPIRMANILDEEITNSHSNNINIGRGNASRTRKYYIQQHIRKKPIANDYWGASMDTYDSNCFRVYYQNINGLTSGESMEKWTDIVTTMKEHKCDIFGYAETNTNWHYNNTKNSINHIINKQFPNASTNLSDNRFIPNNASRFLPGGTIQSCTGYWTSRLITNIQDPRKMG
jgi:hypothetical protein